jgi:hypothetical protein
MSKTADMQTRKPTGDLVLQEVWRIKDMLSAPYGHDLDRLFAEARERQNRSGHPVVNRESANEAPQDGTEGHRVTGLKAES